MGKQESFAKLTEDLENLSKTDEPKAEEVKEEEVVEEEVKEEEKVEEPKAEEPKEEEIKAEEVAQPEIPEVVPQAEAVPEVAPEPEAVEEEVEKSKKDDKKDKKDKDDKDDEDNDDDDDKKDDKKKDGKPVKKSEEEISELDFIGAFEAVVKSFGSVKEELASVKSEFNNFMTFVKENMVMKSVEEPVVEEAPVAEEVSKSVEEEPEGKAVEFIAKSEDGVPVEEPVVEEEAPKEFVASEHVSTVTDYFMKNAQKLDPGRQSFIRAAVQRVKRGQGGQPDVDLFKEIVNFSENSEN